MKFNIRLLPHGKGLPLPTYATKESAGMDLGAAIESPITLDPGKRVLIGCGFQMSMPAGYEAQIRSRSGLSYKNGLIVMNAPGTIDSDYRGEVKVLLLNLGEEPFVIERGMRIAQLIIAPVQQIEWEEKEDLQESERDAAGFGSTGVRPLEGAA